MEGTMHHGNQILKGEWFHQHCKNWTQHVSEIRLWVHSSTYFPIYNSLKSTLLALHGSSYSWHS